jgi:predicted enzyme related to lactoylglutathione lyase
MAACCTTGILQGSRGISVIVRLVVVRLQAGVVFGVESVRATHDMLSKRGVAFINEPRIVDGTNWAANFNDPDGHLLSIFGPE